MCFDEGGEDIGGSFGDKGVGGVFFTNGDNDILGFLQLPETAVLHPGAQQFQGARHSRVTHALSAQQPQYLEEITLIEIGECQQANRGVKESVSMMGAEAHLMVQDKLNTVID